MSPAVSATFINMGKHPVQAVPFVSMGSSPVPN